MWLLDAYLCINFPPKKGPAYLVKQLHGGVPGGIEEANRAPAHAQVQVDLVAQLPVGHHLHVHLARGGGGDTRDRQFGDLEVGRCGRARRSENG